MIRLQAIANLIENAKNVVDIGSDHAFLSLLLIKQKRAQIVYNIEKNKSPYEVSVKNTKFFENQIINILSDGFAGFDKNIVVDYCVISGMGAHNMLNILNACQNQINNLILCANNNVNLIREFAYEKNYNFIKDFSVLENNRIYPIIWLSNSAGIKPLNDEKSLYCGLDILKQEDNYYKLDLENKISLLKKHKNLKENNYAKYLELQIYIQELQRWK
ncbi:MAG: SAM-dependent methyltransferase [Malacoplasma sp.]|nr:SAM-dependent methyltransferase [Malacoplasma sp.]